MSGGVSQPSLVRIKTLTYLGASHFLVISNELFTASFASFSFGSRFIVWIKPIIITTGPELVGFIMGPSFRILFVQKSIRAVFNIIKSELWQNWSNFRMNVYFCRIRLRDRGDKRLEKYDSRPLKFLIPFSIQVIWVYVMLLPTITFNLIDGPPITIFSYIGNFRYHLYHIKSLASFTLYIKNWLMIGFS